MTTPIGLLGATILFWGSQTGLWALAAALALALEGCRLVARRWDLSLEDFNRVTDASTLVFAGLVVYAYSTRSMTLAVMSVVSWIPLCFAPVLLAQALSTRGTFSVSVLFWALRRRARQGESFAELRLGWPYFMVTLLAASAANVRTPVFFLGMFSLSSWALLALRPRASKPYLAAALLLASGALGFISQDGLHRLQGALEKTGAELLYGIVEVGADPYQTRTAIGSIGSLLQSDAIVARVRPVTGGRVPDLLRRASYNLYRSGTWHTADAGMTVLAPSGDGMTWVLAPGPLAGGESVAISFSLRRGQGLLALPPGVFRVEGLMAGSAHRGKSGTVIVDEGPGLASYRALFSSSSHAAAGPDKADLAVPETEASLMSRLASELALDPKNPADAMAKISRFFDKGFSYSTYQGAGKIGEKPLERFLLKTRSGHCEYFATATTLLLRSAGIPARYCVGWSVQEYSRLEKSYIVRQRHSHAWTLAYEGGIWRDFDTTPDTWSAVESEGTPWWSPMGDLWSWMKYQVSRWRWEPRESGPRSPWVWVGLALLLAMAARQAMQMRSRAVIAGRAGPRPASPGRDSEFYLIEKALSAKGWGRRPEETWKAWLKRLEKESGFPSKELEPLAALHERYRFDPAGIAPAERQALAEQASRFTNRLLKNR